MKLAPEKIRPNPVLMASNNALCKDHGRSRGGTGKGHGKKGRGTTAGDIVEASWVLGGSNTLGI